MDIETTQRLVSWADDTELFRTLAKLGEFEPAEADLIGDLARAELRTRGHDPDAVPGAVARILDHAADRGRIKVEALA